MHFEGKCPLVDETVRKKFRESFEFEKNIKKKISDSKKILKLGENYRAKFFFSQYKGLNPQNTSSVGHF